MNTIAAASLFDSPWVLLVILLAGALAQWLMKRRMRREAARRSQGEGSQSASGSRQPSQRELDLQDALRDLLGGEPSPRAPQPPPLPPAQRGAQPEDVWFGDEPFERERTWTEAPPAIPEPVRPPPIQIAPPPRPEPVRQVRPVVPAARTSGLLAGPATRAAVVVTAQRKRSSRTGARAVALVRDARTVRQAFLASLVFGPPKAFETSRP